MSIFDPPRLRRCPCGAKFELTMAERKTGHTPGMCPKCREDDQPKPVLPRDVAERLDRAPRLSVTTHGREVKTGPFRHWQFPEWKK